MIMGKFVYLYLHMSMSHKRLVQTRSIKLFISLLAFYCVKECPNPILTVSTWAWACTEIIGHTKGWLRFISLMGYGLCFVFDKFITSDYKWRVKNYQSEYYCLRSSDHVKTKSCFAQALLSLPIWCFIYCYLTDTDYLTDILQLWLIFAKKEYMLPK